MRHEGETQTAHNTAFTQGAYFYFTALRRLCCSYNTYYKDHHYEKPYLALPKTLEERDTQADRTIVLHTSFEAQHHHPKLQPKKLHDQADRLLRDHSNRQHEESRCFRLLISQGDHPQRRHGDDDYTGNRSGDCNLLPQPRKATANNNN